MKSPLEWSDLCFVLAVCREGTLSGAARVLGVNHSTVFRRVIAAEKKLEVRLFDRLATGYIMTEAGEAFLVTGERVENEILGLSRKLVGRDLDLSGVLRVSAPDALLTKVLMPYLAKFSQIHPQIQLEIIVSNNYQNLTKREADIAVRVSQSPPEIVAGRSICKMMTTIYGSNEYLDTRSDSSIEDYDWLMPHEDLIHLPITKWLSKMSPQASVVMRCNTLLGLYEGVISGMGIASLPCFLADTDPRLRRILPPPKELTSELWLLTHPDLRRTARIRAFMDFLTAELEKEKDLIEGYVR